MKPVYWRSIPLVLFILLIVIFWRGLSLDPQNLPSAQLNKSLLSFRLQALEGNGQELTPAELAGKWTLLNVWASWCDACTEEQLFLMQLAHSGVVIYGLNYKDNPKNARRWLAEWGNPYKMVGEDLDGKVAIDLGVYGAPETFLIDKAGVIRYRHVGVLNEAVWHQEFLPKIKQLEKMA